MDNQAFVGLACLVGGVLGYRYAYELAQLNERLDAIGSTTSWDAVEPANWKVILYQFGSIVIAGVGGLALLAGLF
ncbi:hypothetical protein ACFOZ7_02755 [Natribaculum luteum]|uniref:DUF6199 domain-containing protein n=1 Tax=Natribaculum luteum TaxID=1586232 RepID=A0ABD5NV68_9EURY|nr:hypothetical protein [Natribaculum luteum]